jgi:hypothetical protein
MVPFMPEHIIQRAFVGTRQSMNHAVESKLHLFDTHSAYFAGTQVVVPGTDTRSLVNIND